VQGSQEARLASLDATDSQRYCFAVSNSLKGAFTMHCPHCGEDINKDVSEAAENDGIAMGCGCVIGAVFWVTVGLVMYFTI